MNRTDKGPRHTEQSRAKISAALKANKKIRATTSARFYARNEKLRRMK